MEKVYNFFYDFLINRGIEIDIKEVETFDLIHSGKLDSFDLMSMLIEVEVELGVKLAAEQIVNVSSVKDISEMIIAQQ